MDNGVKNLVGNSLDGALALELAQRGHARSATALSPAGFFEMAGRIRAMAVLIPIRLVSFLPVFLLRVALSNKLVRRLAGRALYTHPERFTAAQILDDAISMRGAYRIRCCQSTRPKPRRSACRMPTMCGCPGADMCR